MDNRYCIELIFHGFINLYLSYFITATITVYINYCILFYVISEGDKVFLLRLNSWQLCHLYSLYSKELDICNI